MKKAVYAITFCVATIAVILLVITGKYIPTRQNNPQIYLKAAYVSNPGYRIQVQKTNGHYTGFLGKDKENVYLDLFQDGKYFGRSVGPIKESDTIWVYQFQQYETLIVIFGDNPNSKCHSYSLEVESTTSNPKRITKDINNDRYVLDIYVLDKKYNGNANLELMK